MLFEASTVRITTSRWYVHIALLDEDGQETEVLVASADPYLTDRAGLWFGPLEEYEEAGGE